jgi:hypothetical protein
MVPNCCWPNTNKHTTNQIDKTFGGSGVAVGSAGIPVAYYGLFTTFATQKTMSL